MSDQTPFSDRFWPLVETACLGALSREEGLELQALLRGNTTTQRLYLEYCRMHSELRFLSKTEQASSASLTHIRQPLFAPFISVPATAYHGTVNFFSQEVPFSILMATLFMIVGGLIGSVMTVEHYSQMPGQSQYFSSDPFASNASSDKTIKTEKEAQWVGRITGMVDVKWSDDKDYLPPMDSHVALGRKYKLDSGLMEITYYTGARVILQGPCNYQVESPAGGYLSLGKLTAKVETEKAKGFFVRTPTVLVTDLGTEFGVEMIGKKSHVAVFRGRVMMKTVAGGTTSATEITLAEGESASIDAHRTVTRSSVLNPSSLASSSGFLRALPKYQTIPVINPSFEEPRMAEKPLYFGSVAIPGWKTTGNGSVVDTGIQRINRSMPWEVAGLQTAFIGWRNCNAAIQQTLDARVGDFSTLVLTAYTGVRSDERGTVDVEVAVQLYAADSDKLLGEARQRMSRKGMWLPLQLRCNPPDNVPPDDHLKIVLRRIEGGHQVQFDSVRLRGLPSPEQKGGNKNGGDR